MTLGTDTRTNHSQYNTMGLRCLAILGSKNEPLYICAAGDGDDQESTEADVFGFFGDNNKEEEDVSKKEASGFIGKPPSIRHEVRRSLDDRKHCDATIARASTTHSVYAAND